MPAGAAGLLYSGSMAFFIFSTQRQRSTSNLSSADTINLPHRPQLATRAVQLFDVYIANKLEESVVRGFGETKRVRIIVLQQLGVGLVNGKQATVWGVRSFYAIFYPAVAMFVSSRWQRWRTR